MPKTVELTIPDSDSEELFGRDATYAVSSDEDDVLVRKEKATREQFDETVTVIIDGFPVVVPLAVPKTDSQGAELRDERGELVPRRTTVYDAGRELVRLGTWTEAELKERLPVLCHMSHLNPVAVCRVCSVHVVKVKKDVKRAERKLFPACHLEVSRGLEVTTRLGFERFNPDTRPTTPDDLRNLKSNAEKVQRSVGLVTEMLYADHKPEQIAWTDGKREYREGKRYENELEGVAGRLGATDVRDRLKRPPGAFARNRMAGEEPDDADPLRPHAKPARRIPLELLAPTAPDPEDPGLGRDADAAWKAWNREVDKRFPYSSRTVVVDHDKCILCDRCVRSCSEVKPFKVIGHTGKGYATRVSFDLDLLMGPRPRTDGVPDADLRPSTCVQCGECMTACPTGALSLRRRVQPRAWDDSPASIPQNPNTPFAKESEFLTADEIRGVWAYYVPPARPGEPPPAGRVVFPFASVPFAYLKWNEGAVRRRVIRPGETEVLAWGGEYGTTAFLLTGTGKFNVYEGRVRRSVPGRLGRWLGRKESTTLVRERGAKINGNPIPGTILLFGEMAPLTQKPRNATIEVTADPAEPGRRLAEVGPGQYDAPPDPAAPRDVVVYEMTRNMLDMFLRSQSTREAVREVYEPRAVERGIYESKMLRGLTDDEKRAVTSFLVGRRPGSVGGAGFVPGAARVEFISAAPGDVLLAEGEPARDFYLIRVGSVEITKSVGGQKQVLGHLSDGDPIGEVALLAADLKDRGVLPPGASLTRRQATVAAIDPVEVVRIPGDVFQDLCDAFPRVFENLMRLAEARLTPSPAQKTGLTGDYVAQGLFQGQKLLVLDLISCTRCDECTRACADSHDGNARLLRDGLRFGDFLVATSCRSCHKPYCMDGCPVDAIHRQGTGLEVKIENHCIGCGLCERNCPYGSIHMTARPGAGAGQPGAAARRAVNCDLCASVGGDPFCVSACPHDAAFRVTGEELQDWVLERIARKWPTAPAG